MLLARIDGSRDAGLLQRLGQLLLQPAEEFLLVAARAFQRALDHAGRTGYLQHEFGDSCLVLPGALLERLAVPAHSLGHREKLPARRMPSY